MVSRVCSVFAGVLAVCGCGGRPAEQASPTPVPVTVTPSVAIVGVTSTSSSTTITSTPPTVPGSEPATPGSTASSTPLTLQQEIQLAMDHYLDAYDRCGEHPATCDPSTFLAQQGTARKLMTSFVEGLNANGQRFSTDRRGSYIRVIDANAVGIGQVDATTCWYDAGVILGPSGVSSSLVVVNDEVGSSRGHHILYYESGVWLVGRELIDQDLGGGDKCQ